MDRGLKEAIVLATLANPRVERPLPLEGLIDELRWWHTQIRNSELPPDQVAKFMKDALRSARDAAAHLPPGELKDRMLSGELIPEEDWERMVGPPDGGT
jgi:hypothetical protein